MAVGQAASLQTRHFPVAGIRKEIVELKIGDKVAYIGQHHFGMKNWVNQKYVSPGDTGVVVEAGHTTQWWKVDFGEERVVIVFESVLEKGLYRKVVV